MRPETPLFCKWNEGEVDFPVVVKYDDTDWVAQVESDGKYDYAEYKHFPTWREAYDWAYSHAR